MTNNNKIKLAILDYITSEVVVLELPEDMQDPTENEIEDYISEVLGRGVSNCCYMYGSSLKVVSK